MKCGFDKIAAIVVTDLPDKTRPFSPPDDVSRKISENIIAFFEQEVAAGRLTNSLLPLQSGVGNVANAVLSGLQNSRFEHLTCYTEVVQDSMLDLIRSGKVDFASTTALSPSPEALEKFLGEVDFFKDKILLRPQEISNSPEVARRLGVIAMNTAIEMDIYGNVNSTHIMGCLHDRTASAAPATSLAMQRSPFSVPHLPQRAARFLLLFPWFPMWTIRSMKSWFW